MKQKPIHPESSVAIRPRGKTEVPVIVIKTSHDLLLQHSQSSPAAAHRFESFIEWVVCHGATKLEPTERVIACALAFESLNASDLLAFLESSSKAIRRGEAIHIAWERENRIHRRSPIPYASAIAAGPIRYAVAQPRQHREQHLRSAAGTG